MKKYQLFTFFLLVLLIFQSCKQEKPYHLKSNVPDLQMPNNKLNFKRIKDYKNYKIIATHFRTDKKELRYILANEKAFESYKKEKGFVEGSILVKIGWNVVEMKNFSPALEAQNIQRIEYMIKDSKRFSENPGKWGYARFVKRNGIYKSWNNGTESCISCHNIAKNNQYVFSKIQELD